ncbi:hypothetical protein HMPREF9993_08248 [Staphylococcus epidermidis NIHLM087]|jgi:hypothetical protein|nr:hypothetical protein HMPREF9995_08493 [Staphylococcus epidermidis NIHLM095]EJD78389.1 hypothetical protein HMPREF9993_08248 [Staphylococcus epidermidis NIHLM087]
MIPKKIKFELQCLNQYDFPLEYLKMMTTLKDSKLLYLI